jgi:hypothetical protein
MDFPPVYTVFPAKQFLTAAPRSPGSLGVELLAQVRPNGRIIDHYKLVLGGSSIVNINTPMMSLFPDVPEAWRFRQQVWARDIDVRRNMTTTVWANINTLLAAREAWVEDAAGVHVPMETVLEALDDKKAAMRWAVVASDDETLELLCQALPASAETLMGKPALRG